MCCLLRADPSTILNRIRPGRKSFRSFFPIDINVVHYCCILSTEIDQLNKFPATIDCQEKSGMNLNKAHLSRRVFNIPSRDIYHIADITVREVLEIDGLVGLNQCMNMVKF